MGQGPLPPVPGVFRLRVLQTVGEDTSATTNFYFEAGGSPFTPGDLTTAANNLMTNYTASLFGTDWILNGCLYTDLSSNTGSQQIVGITKPGTASDMGMPAGVAVICKAQVTQRYRGGHTRVYFPGMSTSLLKDSQTLTTSGQTNVQTMINAIINAVEGASYTGMTNVRSVSVSYHQGFTNVLYPSGRYKAVPTLRSTPLVRPVSSWTADFRLGSQRRRNVRGG